MHRSTGLVQSRCAAANESGLAANDVRPGQRVRAGRAAPVAQLRGGWLGSTELALACGAGVDFGAFFFGFLASRRGLSLAMSSSS